MFRVLIGLVLAGAALANTIPHDERIIGGQSVSISKVPYIVQLRYNGNLFCAGTLVTSNIVVTAAHCLDDINPMNIIVVGGATSITEVGVQRRVMEAKIPQGYTSQVKHMDAAVLRLDASLEGKNIATLNIANEPLEVGTIIRISGWGKISETGPYPDDLRTATVTTISSEQCANMYKGVAKITSSMFCASIPGIRDACQGDSGGPAVANGKLVGIVSWGIGCARSTFPGVYTDLYKIREFIQYAMQHI